MCIRATVGHYITFSGTKSLQTAVFFGLAVLPAQGRFPGTAPARLRREKLLEIPRGGLGPALGDAAVGRLPGPPRALERVPPLAPLADRGGARVALHGRQGHGQRHGPCLIEAHARRPRGGEVTADALGVVQRRLSFGWDFIAFLAVEATVG